MAVLNVGYGVGPAAGSSASYGNYLEVDAGERGDNFLTEHIWKVVQDRIAQGGGVERNRCLHNLLSSQPMCFNLFGQLVDRPELATVLFSALLPELVGEVERVTSNGHRSPRSGTSTMRPPSMPSWRSAALVTERQASSRSRQSSPNPSRRSSTASIIVRPTAG
jgi:hypothetical protein